MQDENKGATCKMVEIPAPAPKPEEPRDPQELEILSRDEILAAPVGGTVHLVAVPDWGAKKALFIREWTGRERDAFEESVMSKRDRMVNFRARLCAAVICNENGKLLLTNEDVLDLGRKSAKALDRIFSAATQINGLSPKDVEDMEKNSGGAQRDASG